MWPYRFLSCSVAKPWLTLCNPRDCFSQWVIILWCHYLAWCSVVHDLASSVLSDWLLYLLWRVRIIYGALPYCLTQWNVPGFCSFLTPALKSPLLQGALIDFSRRQHEETHSGHRVCLCYRGVAASRASQCTELGIGEFASTRAYVHTHRIMWHMFCEHTSTIKTKFVHMPQFQSSTTDCISVFPFPNLYVIPFSEVKAPFILNVCTDLLSPRKCRKQFRNAKPYHCDKRTYIFKLKLFKSAVSGQLLFSSVPCHLVTQRKQMKS